MAVCARYASGPDLCVDVTDNLGLLRSQFARDQISDLDLEETHVQNMLSVLPMGKDDWTNVFDIMPLLFRLTIDSSTEFIFGESLDVQLAALPNYTHARGPLPMSETEFASAFDAAQATVAQGGILNHLYWLVHDREFKENCRRCHVFIDHYVQLALRKEKKTSDAIDGAEKPRYVFLDGLVETTRDPIRLRGQLLSILVASRDTTASLLSFFFLRSSHSIRISIPNYAARSWSNSVPPVRRRISPSEA